MIPSILQFCMLNRNSYLSVIKFIFLNLGFDAMIHVIVILVTWDMVKVVYNSKVVIEEEEFVEVVSKKPAQVKKKEVAKQKVVKVPKIEPFCRKEKRRRRLERMCPDAMFRATMNAFILHDCKKILDECDRRLILCSRGWVDRKMSICRVGYDKKLKITKNRGIKAWNKKAMDLLWFRENEYDDLCKAFANVCTNKYE